MGPKYKAAMERLWRYQKFRSSIMNEASTVTLKVKQYTNARHPGQDPDLKAFAAKTLPVVNHLQMARNMISNTGAVNQSR